MLSVCDDGCFPFLLLAVVGAAFVGGFSCCCSTTGGKIRNAMSVNSLQQG